MLRLKTNPVGIDVYIQNAQKQIYRYFMNEMGFDPVADEEKYECYGRIYRNQDDKGYVAEMYAGGNEYKEVYWDDSLYALSFFGVQGDTRPNVLNQADVHLVFFANLSKLNLKDKDGNAISHRADEELRRIVRKALGKFSYGMCYSGFELGIENVLREYPGSRRDDRLKFVDMHPVHCFRFNYTLMYDPNKIC